MREKPYKCQLPPTVTLPTGSITPAPLVRKALGGKCRQTLITWRAHAGFPAMYLPGGYDHTRAAYFTDEVARWLTERGVIVERSGDDERP
ncbi:hypothetical protein V6617_16820 [Pelagibacterium nitratireducens]|uniref:Alpha/beta hydrolase n=1 Tax=Pelagibacterium nitratireducens TaxID=1046114 RepID=A0ABZ2I319_9HYPH